MATAHSRQRTERLIVRRQELILAINPAGCCERCGLVPDDLDALHIDHEDGKDYRSRHLSLSSRIARYWRELLAGVRLRVLCKSCNSAYLNNSWRAA